MLSSQWFTPGDDQLQGNRKNWNNPLVESLSIKDQKGIISPYFSPNSKGDSGQPNPTHHFSPRSYKGIRTAHFAASSHGKTQSSVAAPHPSFYNPEWISRHSKGRLRENTVLGTPSPRSANPADIILYKSIKYCENIG